MNTIEQIISEIERRTEYGEYAAAELELAKLQHEPTLDSLQQARLFNARAECAWRSSRLSEASDYADRAHEFAMESDNTGQLVRALLNRATVYRERSHYSESLDLYQEAARVAEQSADPVAAARALMNVGNVLRQLLQYEEATESLQKAYTAFSDLHLPLEAARTANLIGLVCDEQAQPTQALEYYQLALELFANSPESPAKDFSMAWLFKNIGSMHLALGQLDKSHEYFLRAEALFQQMGNRFGAEAVRANIGGLYANTAWSQHDDAQAESLLCTAIEHLQELGDMHEQAKAHRALASLYERQQKWELCAKHFMAFHSQMQEVQSDVAKKRAAAAAYERRIAEMKTEQEVAARYTETIRKQLEIIQRDLQTAERIQQAILPTVEDEIQPWKDQWHVSAKMVAARSVGGDFYDVFRIDEHRFGVVIADVSGKGMPAALFMVESRTMLKLQALSGAAPGEVLTKVNSMLCKENVMSMFVTVFYALFNTQTGQVHFANAGHNPPYISRANGQLEFMNSGGGIILGIVDGAEYTTEELSLGLGDTMFLYTDGVSEAMNEERELFGEERIEPLLAGLEGPHSLSPHIELLLQKLTEFSASAGQTDDITMLFVQRGS